MSGKAQVTELDAASREYFGRYAWEYFQMHASQRLTTFNFYIVLSTVITTGLVAVFHKDFLVPWWIGVLLGVALPVLSIVFWQLDERCRRLIKLAEDALKFLERFPDLGDSGDEPHVLSIMARDDLECQRLGNQWVIYVLRRHYSYASCFRFVFVFFGALGGIIAIGCLFR